MIKIILQLLTGVRHIKVYNRKDFLKLPAGTIYCSGKRWYFDDFCIKAQSWDNDWVYLDPRWSNGHDSGECFDILERSLEDGSSFGMPDAFGRDGGFEEDALFLVFEKEDLTELKQYIEKALIL